LEQTTRLERLYKDKEVELEGELTNSELDTSLVEKIKKQSKQSSCWKFNVFNNWYKTGFGIFDTRMSKFITNPPPPKHWGAAKNGLKYLKGTKNFGLTLGGKIQGQNISKLQMNIKELTFKGLSDADFANSIDDRRSIAGILVELWNSPIAWTSKIQPSVALSTTEAEYMALCKLTQELFNFRNLCKEMNLSLKEPITMMDSYIKIAENDEFHQRTKHIDLRYHFIRGAIKDRIVQIERVDSKNNIADIFTKPLPRIQFQRLREKLRLRPLVLLLH
jgi:hypothetical protein